MQKTLESRMRMVEDTGADRTIVVAVPIVMVMECAHQNGERKTNQEDQ